MDNFDKTCRKIDWRKMAKARKTVKNLAEKRPSLRYLATFLDELAEVAVETHRVKLSEVYPSASTAGLIKGIKDQEKLEKTLNRISKELFESQSKK